MDLENTVKEVISIWKKNEEDIEKRIFNWIKSIEENKDKFIKARKTFQGCKPLMVYTNISTVGKGNQIKFYLRFHGQNVAEIRVKNNVPYLIVNKEIASRNYFKMNQEFKKQWKSKEATTFRKKFLSLEKTPKECAKIHSLEHQVETNLIQGMKCVGKKSGQKGEILNYRPVLLFELPFQMPMPISGSSSEPKYSNGHIDILARTGKGKGVKLSVWELKKHGIRHDAFKDAMQQAVIYATSLVLMLCSEDGKKWYKFLGFSKGIPENLRVEAVVVVSEKQQADFKQQAEEFVNKKELQIDDKGIIIPRVAYYNDKYKVRFHETYHS